MLCKNFKKLTNFKKKCKLFLACRNNTLEQELTYQHGLVEEYYSNMAFKMAANVKI